MLHVDHKIFFLDSRRKIPSLLLASETSKKVGSYSLTVKYYDNDDRHTNFPIFSLIFDFDRDDMLPAQNHQ
jgi:hypothetical protein